MMQHKPIWIDVIDPDDEELAWIKEAYGVVLPELEQLGDLEASARYFEGEDGQEGGREEDGGQEGCPVQGGCDQGA